MKFINYIFSKHSWQIIITLFVFAVVIIAGIKFPNWHQDMSWLDPLAGLGTLILAAFLWFNNLRKAWENELPKRITVQYLYHGKPVMEARNTTLTDIADARTWALQIGQQISGNQQLSFEPYFDFVSNGILIDDESQKSYASYSFKYTLRALPERFPTNTCLLWTLKHNQDGSVRNIDKSEIALT
jgi:hypothetical protein